MNNRQFLEIIRESFETYLNIGTSRSTAKLKPLHGSIAEDLSKRLGPDYIIKSQGYGEDKEGLVDGRYYDKKVDIVVEHDGKVVAGYAVKFVMSNYLQNSNNYFENMLGETANIRSNRTPYFQIFIIFDKLPYYEKEGIISKYEVISEDNISKYFKLSKDNPDAFMHTPDKTLLAIISLKENGEENSFDTREEYCDHYLNLINDDDILEYSKSIKNTFDDTVILNDYETFIEKTYYLIKSKS